MLHDWLGVTKIALVVLATGGAAGLVVGFYENAQAGRRAFVWVTYGSALVGTLQVVSLDVAPWVVGGFVLPLLAYFRLRR